MSDDINTYRAIVSEYNGKRAVQFRTPGQSTNLMNGEKIIDVRSAKTGEEVRRHADELKKKYQL